MGMPIFKSCPSANIELIHTVYTHNKYLRNVLVKQYLTTRMRSKFTKLNESFAANNGFSSTPIWFEGDRERERDYFW